MLFPELGPDLDKIIFDPKGTFLKFESKPFHFDFVPEIKGFYREDFEGCDKRKTIAQIEGVDLPFLSKEDLIIDKQALGRDKDISDIFALKAKSYKGFKR